ncbi:hypothetical protein L207DRAFT_518306 [Hyaloscypha variabilis F]|uniref:Uncharacterized protein n=1 Tax=Hyaloscypha variabilis (strain UAMH 11265 / GT02V1 / F) TaxID=1149755 RepID=A0A2J6R2Y6_HYAVF|nr:hypothetical protein L207DRAFT_518306 [Hyaloscypha variabilis F]
MKTTLMLGTVLLRECRTKLERCTRSTFDEKQGNLGTSHPLNISLLSPDHSSTSKSLVITTESSWHNCGPAEAFSGTWDINPAAYHQFTFSAICGIDFYSVLVIGEW